MAREEIDDVDDAIIAQLLADGRRSASEIGRRVGLSPAAAKRRIDRLEAIGVIAGYRAIVDHAKLGARIEAFCEARFEGATQVDDIDRAFVDLPELVEGFTIAGDPDALVRLRVADLDHLKRVIDTIRRGSGVTGTKTLIVLGATPELRGQLSAEPPLTGAPAAGNRDAPGMPTWLITPSVSKPRRRAPRERLGAIQLDPEPRSRLVPGAR